MGFRVLGFRVFGRGFRVLLEGAGDLVRVPKGLLKGIYRGSLEGSIGFRV